MSEHAATWQVKNDDFLYDLPGLLLVVNAIAIREITHQLKVTEPTINGHWPASFLCTRGLRREAGGIVIGGRAADASQESNMPSSQLHGFLGHQ